MSATLLELRHSTPPVEQSTHRSRINEAVMQVPISLGQILLQEVQIQTHRVTTQASSTSLRREPLHVLQERCIQITQTQTRLLSQTSPQPISIMHVPHDLPSISPHDLNISSRVLNLGLETLLIENVQVRVSHQASNLQQALTLPRVQTSSLDINPRDHVSAILRHFRILLI